MRKNIEELSLAPATRGIFEELPCRLYGSRYRGEEAPDGLPFFVVRGNDGAVLARAAVWTNPALNYRGAVPGLVGSFESENDAASAATVLRAAEEYIRARGHQRVIGPMDGSTWGRYRLALPEGAPCLFPLEPMNPPWYWELWEKCGYETLAEYVTKSFPLSEDSFARLEKAERIFARRAITVSDWRPDRVREELDDIFAVSLVSFKNNFLYVPADRGAFLSHYLPLAAKMRPHDAAIARRADGTPVGFVFGFPNPYAAEGAEYVSKTVAVLPDADCRGLGALLAERMAKKAFEDGFRVMYHALMHVDNVSTLIGNHAGAKVCRRYRLYTKEFK